MQDNCVVTYYTRIISEHFFYGRMDKYVTVDKKRKREAEATATSSPKVKIARRKAYICLVCEHELSSRAPSFAVRHQKEMHKKDESYKWERSIVNSDSQLAKDIRMKKISSSTSSTPGPASGAPSDPMTSTSSTSSGEMVAPASVG